VFTTTWYSVPGTWYSRSAFLPLRRPSLLKSNCPRSTLDNHAIWMYYQVATRMSIFLMMYSRHFFTMSFTPALCRSAHDLNVHSPFPAQSKLHCHSRRDCCLSCGPQFFSIPSYSLIFLFSPQAGNSRANSFLQKPVQFTFQVVYQVRRGWGRFGVALDRSFIS
jgi:hypothetical protein